MELLRIDPPGSALRSPASLELEITHTTRYEFSQPVFLDPHMLRFQPRAESQREAARAPAPADGARPGVGDLPQPRDLVLGVFPVGSAPRELRRFPRPRRLRRFLPVAFVMLSSPLFV